MSASASEHVLASFRFRCGTSNDVMAVIDEARRVALTALTPDGAAGACDDRAALSSEPRLHERRGPAHAHAAARAASRRECAPRSAASEARCRFCCAAARARGGCRARAVRVTRAGCALRRGPRACVPERRSRVRAQRRDRGERAPAARRIGQRRRERRTRISSPSCERTTPVVANSRLVEGGARAARFARGARASRRSAIPGFGRALHSEPRRRAARVGAARARGRAGRAARRPDHVRRFRETRARHFRGRSGADRGRAAGRALPRRRLEVAADGGSRPRLAGDWSVAVSAEEPRPRALVRGPGSLSLSALVSRSSGWSCWRRRRWACRS